MSIPLTHETTKSVDSGLPSLPEGITPIWLTHVLGNQVNTVEITKVVHGTASKVFVTVVYDAENESVISRPKFLCIKGGFDPKIKVQYPWIVKSEHQFSSVTGPRLPLFGML